MEDPPLTAIELAELKRLRIGKPPSRALPADAYRDQKMVAHFDREKQELACKKKKKYIYEK